MATLHDVAEALQREKREKRNLARRTAYDRTQQRQSERAPTQQECQKLLHDAQRQCEQILIEGRRKCAAMLNAAMEEAKGIAEKARDDGKIIVETAGQEGDVLLGAARKSLEKLNQKHQSLQQKIRESTKIVDAARRKAQYWGTTTEASLRSTTTGSTSVGSTLRKRARTLASTALDEAPDHAIDCPTPNRQRRRMRGVTTDIVRFFREKVATFNDAAKKAVLAGLWQHAALKPYHPARLGSPKLDASIFAAVTEVKKTLSIIKFAKRKDHLAAKYQILSGFAGQSTVHQRLQTALAAALGIRRQNVHRAAKIRAQLDSDSTKKFPMGERKVRCDKISDAVKQVVQQYWDSHTRISPRKNNFARLWIGRKKHEKHQVHWLEETQAQFYLEFAEWCRREQNEVSIGMRSFLYLMPYYIQKMKDRNVCCCKQHVEIDLLKEALNKFRQHQHCKDCTCACRICRPLVRAPEPGPTMMPLPTDALHTHCLASKAYIPSVRGWIEEGLCKREEGKEWHKKKCVMGECDKCGVHNVQWCEMELDQTMWIDWQAFENVELDETAQQKRERKKGNAESNLPKATRIRLVYKRTSMSDFKKRVLEVMQPFIVHNFCSRWQSDQFRKCLKVFPRGTIVSSIDYSENYTFLPQNEIQSEHWDAKQVTLLIHVTYRHREDAESMEAAVGRPVMAARVTREDTSRDIVADYHFYVSDDNKHDTLFVQHCMDLHWDWMAEQGICVDQHWVWSDGAPSQFKACRPFYYVSRYFSRHGARMKWFFHASGHGKGVADALGGHIKTALGAEQLRGQKGHKLENASDVVDFCQNKFALGAVKEYGDVQMVRRVFWEIPKGAVNRQKRWDCDPIKGCRSLHSFDGFSFKLSTLLQVRDLSCFCAACIDDDSVNCENEEWVGKYRLEMVKGVLPSDVRPKVESIGAGISEVEDGDLADCVQLGEWYACIANPDNVEGVDFYIYQCVQVVHTVEKDFQDAYKVAFKQGERALKGLWYEASRNSQVKYVLNETAGFSYQRPEEVIHVRFALTPVDGKGGGARTFSLHPDTLEAIIFSMGS